MEANSGASEPNSNATIITINVKFGGVSIPISISPHLTINGFKSLLLPSTNVLPRGYRTLYLVLVVGEVGVAWRLLGKGWCYVSYYHVYGMVLRGVLMGIREVQMLYFLIARLSFKLNVGWSDHGVFEELCFAVSMSGTGVWLFSYDIFSTWTSWT